MKCSICSTESYSPICPHCGNTSTFDGRGSIKHAGGFEILVHSALSGTAPATLEIVGTEKKVPVAFPICRIGRNQSNELVILGDDEVSRVHCLIAAEEGYFFVADTGSTNGTLLNENELIEKTPLRDGDCLQIGNVKLRFSYNTEAAPAEGAGDMFNAFVNSLHKRMQQNSSNSGGGYEKPTKEFKPDP